MSGRGGRGGRGGANRSFSKEQLAAIGSAGNENIPGPVTQPPPLYPLLDRKPVPLTPCPEMEYLLVLREDFIDHMQLSGTYLKMPENKLSEPQQEIDKLVAQMATTKEKFDWKLLPSELRPKLLASRVKKKIVKEIDIEQRLSNLQKLEENVKDTNTNVKNEPDEEVEELEEMDEDEEMDDGTDYANNYFDNGEDYDDEDDALEDGPIY